ncbi:hypothetical protein FX984_06371 [Pseudomonas marginalis]|nr:hypothetical protein FX984_06371 [Pseudomonas marginalis]
MALLRRALEVERQLKHGLFTCQQIKPVGELALFLASIHPVALPYGVIGILNRQCRQLQVLTLAERTIQLHQFIDHDVHRPTIGNDMVLYQHQYMVFISDAQQLNTQQRALLQVERERYLSLHGGLEVSLQHVATGDGDRCRLSHDLHGAVVFLAQQSAQALMTRHQAVKALLQRSLIQRPLQAQRAGHVVSGAAWVQLPEEPLPFLGI